MKEIFTTPDIAKAAAEKFVEIAREAIEERGIFTVALSGGSTPKKLYAVLAEGPFRDLIEWEKIQFFFGDERSVLPTDQESNFRLANDGLFSKLEIPPGHIHRFLTEKDEPKVIAETMETEIRQVFSLKADKFPRFDL
jgi:6-phosphogluconolactonase